MGGGGGGGGGVKTIIGAYEVFLLKRHNIYAAYTEVVSSHAYLRVSVIRYLFISSLARTSC